MGACEHVEAEGWYPESPILFFETESFNQTQNSSIWLVSLARLTQRSLSKPSEDRGRPSCLPGIYMDSVYLKTSAIFLW